MYKRKFVKFIKLARKKDDEKKALEESELVDIDLDTPPRKVSDDFYFKAPISPKEDLSSSSDEEWFHVSDANTHLKNNTL